jgi:hypothetical protein
MKKSSLRSLHGSAQAGTRVVGKALLARISRIAEGRHVKIVNGRSAVFALCVYTFRTQTRTRVTVVTKNQRLAADDLIAWLQLRRINVIYLNLFTQCFFTCSRS